MPFLLIILKLNCQDISGENGQRSSTVFGFLMLCWYSYSYRNDQYIFGQGDMTCLRSSKRTLEPSKKKYPLGKHPNNLMPYKIIPRYGIGAVEEAQRLYLGNFFVGIFSKCTTNGGEFGQARPMKHKFCRDFVGTNAGYWRWRPL